MKVGDKIETTRAGWSFGGNTAEAFVGHAERSIPGYREGHELVCQLSDFFCHDSSVCYELGVSTGELLANLAHRHESKPACRWVGIDREEPMIAKATEHCASLQSVELYCDDILSYPFEKSDFIVAYYTMQFIAPRIRQEAYNRIYEALNWGGGFVLFEKVRAPDARFQDMMIQLYQGYKQQQGFSAEEILNKASSLKSVLEPFSTQGNIDLMRRAGFTDIMTIYKNICFEGFLAIK